MHVCVWGTGFNGFKQISEHDDHGSDVSVPTIIQSTSCSIQVIIAWSHLTFIDDHGNISTSPSMERIDEIIKSTDRGAEGSGHRTSRSLTCLNDQIVALLNDGRITLLTSCGMKAVNNGGTEVKTYRGIKNRSLCREENSDLEEIKLNRQLETNITESIHGMDKALLSLDAAGKISSCTLTSLDTRGWAMSSLTPVLCAEPIASVSCGKEHVLLLGQNRQIYSYGGGSRGQLGHGDVVNQREPQLVEALAGVGFSAVAAGGWHSAALSDIGDVWVWGWNESGQLGLPCNEKESDRKNLQSKSTNHSETDVQKPTKLSESKVGMKTQTFIGKNDVFISDQTSELITQSSSVSFDKITSPGSNTCQSNDNQSTARILKDSIPQDSSDVTKVFIGSPSSQPRPVYDRLVSMESHVYVQNCDVTNVQVQSEPCGLDLLDTTVSKISCGARHTALLTDAGVVLTCGWNKYGQLCLGDTKSRDFLQSVDFFVKRNLKVTDIHSGHWNTVIITENDGEHDSVPMTEYLSQETVS
ncbi:RCC1 domain-containing protein DDB_G0279253-like isoform X2 [Mizuhopecten yessoensis]|uniref:RCC1 domain-containing protein 1 n=1 Tax=Mizuhopecten yessoensis TaxID=6573 RepID=A0A210R6B7_MIZYE|nr:RCC1 domain-containing protein DDB_G0279253-like isoform X2 [Mizuhopecten yessoensis]OWF56603.1 RCC1 domain-containing protein 1 [Mizuhopecten yessoensis]